MAQATGIEPAHGDLESLSPTLEHEPVVIKLLLLSPILLATLGTLKMLVCRAQTIKVCFLKHNVFVRLIMVSLASLPVPLKRNSHWFFRF